MHRRDERTVGDDDVRWTSGEALGGDDLGCLPIGERRAGHARSELARAAPEGAHPSRAGETPVDGGLAVDLAAVGVGRRGDVARRCGGIGDAPELFDRVVTREGAPAMRVVGRSAPADQPRLRPRDLGAIERGGHGGQGVEALGHPRRLLHVSPGDAETLAGIVGDANEPEPSIQLIAQEDARSVAELAAAHRLDATAELELAIELVGEAGALRQALALGVGIDVAAARFRSRPAADVVAAAAALLSGGGPAVPGATTTR